MEKMLGELEKVFSFKDTTGPGDIVLVVMENPEAVFYARVASIERDLSKRDEWWHVTMDILSLPPQKVTWTLREPQFTGQEIFTMGGDKRFVKALDFGEPVTPPPAAGPSPKRGRHRLRVVK